MATRTWTSSSSTDMNLSSNYSGAGALLSTDDLVFDATSQIAAVATANLNVNSVTITSTHTGGWSINGFTMTLTAGNFSDDGITNAHQYGNGITLNGASATFHVGAGVVSPVANNCVLTFNGTTGCIFDDDKTTNNAYKSLVLGAGASLTVTGDGTPSFSSTTTPFTITNAATFVVNGGGIRFQVNANVNFVSITGAASISGSAPIYFQSNASAGTLPAFTSAGLVVLQSYGGTNGINLSGNISVGNLQIRQYSSLTTFVINTNNFSISSSGYFYFGNNDSTSTLTLNCGSSTISTATLNPVNNAPSTLNMGTSSWSVSGNFALSSNITVSEGASSVTFTGNSTVTLAGKRLATVVINSPGFTLNFGDSFSSISLLITAGSLTDNGYAATFSSFANLQGATNLTLTGIWTITGDADLTFNASGTATIASWSIVVQGTGRVGCYKAGVSLYNLTCGASGKTTTVDQQGFKITNSLSVGAGVIQINTYLYMNSAIAIPITIATGGKIGISAGNQFQILVPANCSMTLPAITTTAGSQGVLTINSYSMAGSGNSVVNLGGDINVQIFWVLGGGGITAYNITINFNGYNITTVDYTRLGVQKANGVTINLGSSKLTVGTYFETTTWNTNTWNLNLQTGTIQVGTNFTLGTNTTLDGGNMCSIICVGTGTFTTAGQTLCSVLINAPASTVTLGANLAMMTNLTVTNGSFSTSTFTLTAASMFLGGTNITLGAAVTLTGDPATFAISASGVVTITNADIILQGSTTINLGASNKTIARLRTYRGKTIYWQANTGIVTITSVTSGDWYQGASGFCTWRSTTRGTQFKISAPVGVTVLNMAVRDSLNSGSTITATDSTNKNYGNNTGWTMGAIVKDPKAVNQAIRINKIYYW